MFPSPWWLDWKGVFQLEEKAGNAGGGQTGPDKVSNARQAGGSSQPSPSLKGDRSAGWSMLTRGNYACHVNSFHVGDRPGAWRLASAPSDGSRDPAAQLYTTLESHHCRETYYLLTFHFNCPKLHLQPGGASLSKYQTLPWRSAWPREDPVVPGLGLQCYAFLFLPPTSLLPRKGWELPCDLQPILSAGLRTSFLRFKIWKGPLGFAWGPRRRIEKGGNTAESVVSRIMGPPKDIHPNPQNPTWQKGLCRYD